MPLYNNCCFADTIKPLITSILPAQNSIQQTYCRTRNTKFSQPQLLSTFCCPLVCKGAAISRWYRCGSVGQVFIQHTKLIPLYMHARPLLHVTRTRMYVHTCVCTHTCKLHAIYVVQKQKSVKGGAVIRASLCGRKQQ